MVRAVFFDRDGTLNKMIPRGDMTTPPWTIDEFEIFECAREAVDIVKNMGYNLYVVTNQPDLADEKMSDMDLQMMCEVLTNTLDIDDICVAFERGDAYYKPNTGMVDDLVEEYNIDREDSWFIGDTWKDIACANRAGIRSIYIGSDPEELKRNNCEADYAAKDVLAACEIIRELDYETIC
jgi:HAD superfamily hydrolase (TIGR01662 family)